MTNGALPLSPEPAGPHTVMAGGLPCVAATGLANTLMILAGA